MYYQPKMGFIPFLETGAGLYMQYEQMQFQKDQAEAASRASKAKSVEAERYERLAKIQNRLATQMDMETARRQATMSTQGVAQMAGSASQLLVMGAVGFGLVFVIFKMKGKTR